MNNNDFIVSWEQFHRDTGTLTEILRPLGPWSKIVAVTRGGLFPTAIIARELSIRIIDTVCIASYKGREQKPLTILKKIDLSNNDRILFVDDLVDTGETARSVRELYPHAHYAVVYAKPVGKPFVHSYVTEVEQERWIIFPWDAPAEQ